MKKYLIASGIALLAVASLAGAQEYSFTADLTVGASGPDVTALQSWLISNGFDIPSISGNLANKGYFGSQTRQALIRYQSSIGLPGTGYFGPMTRGRIHGGYRGNSLVITSPNGGEVWQKGAVKDITWVSNMKPGITEKFNQTADIKLAFPLPACAQPGANPVCMVKMRAPYTIAKGVSLSNGTYSWNVGSFIFDPVTLPYCTTISTTGDCINSASVVDDGQYKIQICPTNGSQCDESDKEFTIKSGQVSTVAPVINGIDAPTTLTVNQTGTWKVRAIDPQNGALSYLVDWGDNRQCPQGYVCDNSSNVLTTPSFIQTSSFTHSYSTPGTYTIKFTVQNSAGLSAQSTVTVVVSANATGSLKITSPNGNETWVKGTQQNITWTSPVYFRATNADISLVTITPCSNGGSCLPVAPMKYDIAKNISINQNSYSWKVGAYMPPACPAGYVCQPIPLYDGQYTVQICETGTNNCDSSDYAFNITSNGTGIVVPQVASPNGGESWVAYSAQPLRWTSSSLMNQNTKLDLYLDQNIYCITAPCGSSYTLDKNISVSTIYNWVVATDISNVRIPDGNYRFRVCIAGSTTNCDSSDSFFTIKSPASSLLQACPSEKIVNRMPSIYPSSNIPSTYYILNGQRREIAEFDQNWVSAYCTIPEQVVY